jgi:hypothetical protein
MAYKNQKRLATAVAASCLSLAVVLSACDEEEDISVTSENTDIPDPAFSELVRIAREHTQEKGPNIYDFSLPARVTRYDDYWEVTWVLPPNPLLRGGTPIVQLDRSSLDVISAKFQE